MKRSFFKSDKFKKEDDTTDTNEEIDNNFDYMSDNTLNTKQENNIQENELDENTVLITKSDNTKFFTNKSSHSNIDSESSILFKIDNYKSQDKDKNFSIFLKISNMYSQDIMKNNYYEILCLVYTILASILYYLTLHGCEGTQAECLGKFNHRLVKFYFFALIISSYLFLYSFKMYFIYQNIRIWNVLISIFIVLILFFSDTGSNLKHHGFYNAVFLIGLTPITIFFHLITFFLYKIYKKIALMKFIFSVISFCFIIYLLTFKTLSLSCSDWNLGLKGTRIDNNSNTMCIIQQPKICWLHILSNYFDFSKILMKGDCSHISVRNEIPNKLFEWNPFITSFEQIISFPRTEKFDYIKQSTLNAFQFIVLQTTNTMDVREIKSNGENKYNVDAYNLPEITLDFSKKPPEMIQKVIKNNDLIRKRKEESTKNLNENGILKGIKNVIHIFIDQTSRDHFRRKLPKTFSWLEKGYKINNEEIDSKYETFQFLKSQSAGPYTVINLIPIYFGLHLKNSLTKEDFTIPENYKHKNYVHFFKNNGFITSQAYNYCSREIIDIEEDVVHYPYEAFDHEYIMCDPHYSIPRTPYSLIKGSYSYLRRCLYGKDTNFWQFNYGKEFWKSYKNEKKFLRLGFQDGHEGSGEIVKYLDDNLFDFLNFIENEGEIDKTAFLFHSDHGLNMPGFFSGFEMEEFWIEKNLPFLYLVLPNSKSILSNEIRENLKSHEQTMVTAFDINNTFKTLSGSGREVFNKLGDSLFYKINNKDERTCGRFRVKSEDCRCGYN